MFYTQEVRGSNPFQSTIFLGILQKMPFLLAYFSYARREDYVIFIRLGHRVLLGGHKKGPFRAFFSNGKFCRIQTVLKTPCQYSQ